MLAVSLVAGSFRACLGRFSSQKPPMPSVEVIELLQDLKITPRLVIQCHQIFKRLKQNDPITLRVGPQEVSSPSMTRLATWRSKISSKIAVSR